MHRHTPRLALAALATLAFAACQDNAPTAPPAAAGPLAAKGGNGNGNGNQDLVAGATSTPGGVAPTARDGNTAGDGNVACADYGGMGVKVDGNYDQNVAGYAFHVQDGTTLSFSRATPGYAVTAVLVKGGSAYDVYNYETRVDGSPLNSGITADGGLTSPRVGKDSKNIPDISHYTVCYVRNIHVSKQLVAVLTSDGNGMKSDPAYATGGPVVIPQGETRWLQFEIKYEQAPGSTGTLTEIVPDLCRSAGFSCSSPDFDTSKPDAAKFTVTGSGTKVITLDVTSRDCSGGTLTNRVMFDAPQVWADASASVYIAGLCKTLKAVYTTGMTPVNGWQQSGMVEVPRDGIRWLEYQITYTLPAGATATLRDVIPEACAGAGITCSSAGLNDSGSSMTVTGNGSPQYASITVDVHNKSACGDRPYVNTVNLVRSGGLSTSASSRSITIWPDGPECPH